ncbi:DUF6600 domain-containing protein [Ferrovibrio sp.]|uniref:DUF6600 domain-containing protein n=1 Tax=Ferrovibrio sp. TaxID=1917215 RepID=UPI000CB69F2F|nr:DUF6600 domain-containing protein [Ferrovibrio sp.]PJI37701.1 MAG: hypothetical protein CTR53_18880 [Ferrovibrio sp.]
MSMHRGFKVVATAARRTLAVCATSALITSTTFTPLASVFAQTPQTAQNQTSQGDAAKPWPGPPITAQNSAGDPPARVGRIARMNGTVSFHTTDEDQWGPAKLNYPLTSGNALWTEPNARAELQIGSGNRLVMDSKTELNVIALDDTRFEAGLPQGTAYLNVDDVAPGESYTLQTPRGSVQITEPGRYVIAAGDDDTPTTVTALDGGKAQLSGRNLNQAVPAGQQAALTGPLDGDEPVKPSLAPAAPQSTFVQSVLADEKAPQTAAAPASAAPPAAPAATTQTPRPPAPAAVPAQVQGMTGAQDLSSYGSWSTAPDYGAVWYPPVETGWVPYRHGHWAYVPPWGWTWVADEPWGFAPFHYGRWVMVRDRWAWSPGVVVTVRRPHHHHHYRPVYAPALVAFFGTGSGVSISITAGNVGWVPLGWHEAYYPPYRVSRTYIRNVNVTHVTNITKVTNVTNVNNVTVNRFVNRNSATVVSADAMRRSEPVQRAVQRPDRQQIESARIDRRARIEPTAMTAGMSPKTAERMGIRSNDSRGSERRDAPGPQIRQTERRATDLKPVETRQVDARRTEPQSRNRQQAQPRQEQARPEQPRQEMQQRAAREQQRAAREQQRQPAERQQNVQDRQRQELQRQDNMRQQRENQERQTQDHRRQQQELQRQTQQRQQQDVQRQHGDQQQREAQRRQKEAQPQSRPQDVRRQQQDADDQRRQRREQN